MCLHKVTGSKSRKRVAYKVLTKSLISPGHYGLMYFRTPGLYGEPCSIGSTYKAADTPGSIYTDNGQRYESGFHSFSSLSDAQSYKEVSDPHFHYNLAVVKVRIKGNVAVGTHFAGRQSDGECIVSKYITLVKEID